jgi:hypothetical protein
LDTPDAVVAKVEWHPGERGFIVTNLSRPAERVVAFYNKRDILPSLRKLQNWTMR